MLPVVVVGHVDHGKSTLLGRLLYETDNLPDGKVEAIEAMRERRGMQFEWSFVLDAFKAERDQGITIDTTQIELRTKTRDYLLIDAPGHEEFLKNMITGAANASAALLLIDVTEGVREQTQRHTYLLKLLGVKEVVVVVNKMDLVEYKQGNFSLIKREISSYLSELDIKCQGIIPASARAGDNLSKASSKMSWYSGLDVLSSMNAFKSTAMLIEGPLRIPVQDIYRFDHRRIVVGKIESGRVKVGDEICFSPTGKAAVITSLEAWNSDLKVSAGAGESIALTLDRELFIERGHVVHSHGSGPSVGHDITVRLIWFAKTPLKVGAKLQVKFQTATHQVIVSEIKAVIDLDNLSLGKAQTIQRNTVAEIVLHSRTPFAVDPIDRLEPTARGVLFDSYNVVGGCIVLNEVLEKDERHIYPTGHRVGLEQRAAANGHNSGVLWFTGLSGSGKSTLAMALEYELFQRGWQSYVLDGDNVRDRLNSDLGFSPEDRGENIRRVAEVARLGADSGNIVISAFISPYQADRERARQIAEGGFHEIYIKANIETCEERDPKGLYAKARRGEIREFTGIDAPYEAPDNPDLIIDTGVLSTEECIQVLAKYVDENFGKGSAWHRDVA
jgi:bifunctional enzyme CysN/CysC